MIQSFALSCVNAAAMVAGLPEGRLMPLVTADNITLPRPRIEYQILPARYRRTGRLLGITPATTDNPVQLVKRELYAVDLDISLNVMAPDTKADAPEAEGWLADFEPAFITALPRGGNDAAGNWVRLTIQKASRIRPPDVRLGAKDVRVFTKFGAVFVLSCAGRLTEECPQRVMTTVNINLPGMGTPTRGK